MPSHVLLFGHTGLRQFGSSAPPVRVVDCDQSRPALHSIATGGWGSSYARTRSGEVYSLQAAVYRVVPLTLPGTGRRQAVAMDLPAASKVTLPDGEQCVGLSVGWEGLVAAVTDRGSLVCWQDGEEGQPEVSRPRSDTGTTPASKGRSRFVAVAVATGLAVVALAEDGSLWSWKPKRMRRDAAAPDDLESVSWPCSRSIAQAPRIAEVSCGRRHVALRDCDGQAWTYGWGLYGQLGHGDSRDCETPTLVTATERHSDPGWGPCIRVACGGWHTAFLLCTAGVHTDTTTLATRLLTCGWNEGGQLGHTCRAEAGAEATSSAGSSTHTQAQDHTSGSICNVPTPVPSFDGIPLSGIACGSRFTLAATTAGELFAFGWSVRGELSRTLSSTHPLSTPSASKRKRGDTSRTQEDDSDDGQQYWHEPVCLTTEDEDVKDVCSSAATVVVDASSLSSGGWHASVGCDFD